MRVRGFRSGEPRSVETCRADFRNVESCKVEARKAEFLRVGAKAPTVTPFTTDRRRTVLKHRPCDALILLSIVFIFLLAPGYSQSPTAKAAPSRTNAVPVTVTGEVVDTWCYSSHVMGEGRGPKHEKCARSCIAGGVAIGIVDDQGKLYIASKHHGYQGCMDLLMKYVAKRVTVSGWMAKGGSNAVPVLKITSVKPAK